MVAYLRRVGHALSHLFNALVGGREDETFSCYLGRTGRLPWIAWVLNKWDTKHCQKAVINESNNGTVTHEPK